MTAMIPPVSFCMVKVGAFHLHSTPGCSPWTPGIPQHWLQMVESFERGAELWPKTNEFAQVTKYKIRHYNWEKHNETHILLHVVSHEGQVWITGSKRLFHIHNKETAIFVILEKRKWVLLGCVPQAMLRGWMTMANAYLNLRHKFLIQLVTCQ